MHWRLALLALAEGDPARAWEEAERMEAALAEMGPEGVPEHAIMARFDLAKFWSAQGAPNERQFLAAVAEGNRAVREGRAVDHKTVVAAFDRIIAPNPMTWLRWTEPTSQDFSSVVEWIKARNPVAADWKP